MKKDLELLSIDELKKERKICIDKIKWFSVDIDLDSMMESSYYEDRLKKINKLILEHND